MSNRKKENPEEMFSLKLEQVITVRFNDGKFQRNSERPIFTKKKTLNHNYLKS